jgi:2-isopropylmalate synthase
VEAVSDALERYFSVDIAVEAYDEFALEEGTSAKALACIRLNANGEPRSAAALAEDTTSATLQALFSAVAQAVEVTPAVEAGRAAAAETV